MIVLNLYIPDTQVQVKCILGCQPPTPPLTVGYFPSIPPRMDSLIQKPFLQPLL